MNNLTIYHTEEWKKVLTKTYGYKPYYYNNCTNEELFLPAMLVKNFLLRKKFFCSLPFSDEVGPVANNESNLEEIFIYLDNIFKKEKLNYIELKGVNKNHLKIAEKFGYKEIYENYRFVIDLSNSLESIHNNFHLSIKRQLKKNKSLNLSISKENLIKEFYNLHTLTMKRLGTPPHNKYFFDNLFKYLSKNAIMISAFFNGEHISSVILLVDPNKNKSRYVFGAYNWLYKNLNANTILFYEAIKYSQQIGCRYFDFGVSREGSGVWNFKKKWCGQEPVKEYYLYKLHSAEIIDIREKKFQYFTKIWQNYVPGFLANFIGPFIRKQLGK